MNRQKRKELTMKMKVYTNQINLCHKFKEILS
uniref:Uncharacterized protein n=1 Tax=Rhizophora mucronata TaxID=61149 RepID=A0A2P2R071_RHIMU